MRILLCLLILSQISFGYHHSNHKTHHHKGFTRKTKKSLGLGEFVSFLDEKATLPNSFSLQDTASPVEDQGQCGSCWDFSLTGGLRDSYLSQNLPDPGRLSFGYLLNCAQDMYGCNGGDFDAANHMVNGVGPYSWNIQPYLPYLTQCKKFPATASAASWHVLGGKQGPSFKDIAYALAVEKIPLITEIAADDAFQEYDDGVYDNCSSQDIDHMVILNGYDCEGLCQFDTDGNLPPGRGSYLIKNSWGESWGEKGYIRIKATDLQGRRCDAVATEAIFYDIKGPVKQAFILDRLSIWANMIENKIRNWWRNHVPHSPLSS